MGEVIFLERNLWNIQRLNRAKDNLSQDNVDLQLITQTPRKVQEILSSFSHDDIVEIKNLRDIEDIIFEYIVQKLDKQKISFHLWVIQATKYLSNYLFRLWFTQDDEIIAILQNPYFTYWVEKWFPKIAGDVSVYKFLFYKDTSRNIIPQNNYKDFAVNWYNIFYWREFAIWIEKILEQIKDKKELENFFKQK